MDRRWLGGGCDAARDRGVSAPAPPTTQERWSLRRLDNASWFVLVGWLTLCFSLFGIASLNLFLMLRANLRFISEHGLDALVAGGALQLAVLVATAYAAMVFYTLAKWFEHRLMDRMTMATASGVAPAASSARTTTTTRSPRRERRPSSARLRPTVARRDRTAPR